MISLDFLGSFLCFLPNILSLLRIFLAPWGAWVLYNKKTPSLDFLVILFVFFITDFLDGYLARRYGCTTSLGKILDPLGDKVMAFSFLTAFYFLGWLPSWFFFLLVGKDFLLMAGGLFLLALKTPFPSVLPIAKINTFVQGLFLGSLVLREMMKNYLPSQLDLQISSNFFSTFIVKSYGFFSMVYLFFSVILVGTTLLSLGLYGQKTYTILRNFFWSLP